MGIQETLKALSDPVRRDILEHLKHERMPAGDIADLFDISAPAVSRHLSVLKNAGLVRDYREGKYIFYETGSPAAARRSQHSTSTWEEAPPSSRASPSSSAATSCRNPIETKPSAFARPGA